MDKLIFFQVLYFPFTTHFPVSGERPPPGLLRLESLGVLVRLEIGGGHGVIGNVDVDHRPLLQLLLLQLVHVGLVTPVGEVVGLNDDVKVILKVSSLQDNQLIKKMYLLCKKFRI